MDEYVGHPSFNLWCACHRSGLAMEDLVASAPELTIWKANACCCCCNFLSYIWSAHQRAKDLVSEDEIISSTTRSEIRTTPCTVV